MPSNYTLKRLIWAFYSDSSGNVTSYTQSGDYGYLDDAVSNLDTTTPATSWTALTLLVPPIEGLVAIGYAWLRNNASPATVGTVLGLSNGIAANPSQRWLGDIDISNPVLETTPTVQVPYQLQVNASGQIKYSASTTTAIRVIIYSRGWCWSRHST
jgi:hypothetical protein